MELQVMLSDAMGLVDFQQQHVQQPQQHGHHHHARNGEHPRFSSLHEAAFGRSSPPNHPSPERRRFRPEGEEDEEAGTSPLATLSPSASSGEEDPSSSFSGVRENASMFQWNGGVVSSRRGGRVDVWAKRGARDDGDVEGEGTARCPPMPSSCGLLAVAAAAAAAAAAMTPVAGRKRKMVSDGEEPVTEGQRSVLDSPPSGKERHQQAVEDEEGHVIRAISQEGSQGGRASSGGHNHHHHGPHGGWHVEDIDDNLAADLEGSLSGLGVDLTSSSSSYHMSESLLSLPALTVFKQEVLSPTSQNDAGCKSHTAANVCGNNEEACRDSPRENNKSPNAEIPLNSDQQHQQSLHHILHYGINNGRRGGGNPSNGQMGSPVEDDGSVCEGKREDEGRVTGPFEGLENEKRLGVTNGSSEASPQGHFHIRFDKNSNMETNEPVEDSRFQYVLAAATSIATKINEETLTYLNQGQSYEIKLKKLGDLLAYRGKIFKSIIRICFHERRLQYAEREQLAAWQQSRPGDRVLEVDVPLSYGACDIVQDPCALNAVEFLWDPTKEVGVYIKVNCISTEFTPKKHGGEKGVPFRIQVETYSQAPSVTSTSPTESLKKTTFVPGRRLHAAACQIKVFKLKGADRKHKQDREKILKRPPSEQEKYQPSYECTVLNDINSESVYLGSLTCGLGSTLNNGGSFSPSESSHNVIPSPGHVKEEGNRSPGGRGIQLPHTSIPGPAPSVAPIQVIPDNLGPHHQSPLAVSSASVLPNPSAGVVVSSGQDGSSDVGIDDLCVNAHIPLSSDASSVTTAQWLRSNRFSSYLHTFASFSGADLLRLSRDDLIQICGLADGIRLFNVLHSKTIAPRLTLYMSLGTGIDNDSSAEGEDGCGRTSGSCPVYHAIYLENASCRELAAKVARLAGIAFSRLHDVFVQGPSGVHVILTDDVVQNLADDSLYTVEVMRDHSGERYRLLLKANSH
ncbi:uncharacterized protein gem [Hetaerina americana]|uniref:uncharacterized protein gem n=1 Tax=Hetaerina americana TaxID=62018 RepID=UPI003A7F3972